MIAWTGCTPGVGRDPVFADAAVIEDVGFRDASPFPDAEVDAGLVDSAVGLPDATIEPEYPFTGIYGILNSTDPLYAREVDGRINLVVRGHPYTYIGTITPEGYVDTESFELRALGCPEATIKGQFDRVGLEFVLEHRTCSPSGQTLLSEIMGGYANDFDPTHSGIFSLTVNVMAANGCWDGLPTQSAKWAVSFIGTNAVSVFTAFDLVPATFYRGIPGSDYSFSALQNVANNPISVETSMMASFEQETANDPLRFTGIRDVYDFTRSCSFTVLFDGTRVEGP